MFLYVCGTPFVKIGVLEEVEVCVVRMVRVGVGVLVFLRKSSKGQVFKDLLVSPGQMQDGKQRCIFSFLPFLMVYIFYSKHMLHL